MWQSISGALWTPLNLLVGPTSKRRVVAGLGMGGAASPVLSPDGVWGRDRGGGGVSETVSLVGAGTYVAVPRGVRNFWTAPRGGLLPG